MQKTMQTHAAVFRTGDVLQEGVEKMKAVWKDMADLKVADSGMSARNTTCLGPVASLLAQPRTPPYTDTP